MEKLPDMALSSNVSSSDGVTVTVDDTVLYQEVDGWGASLTDSSGYVLLKLKDNNDTRYWQVLNQMFGSSDKTGDDLSAAFGIVRLPASTSDFALSQWTFDDTDGDTTLASFDFSPAKLYMVPVMKDILTINPQIKVMLCPWTAPAWMKTSNSLFSGHLKDDMFDVYADYFVKFTQAFQAEGIPVYAVSMQNEPLFEPNTYAGMAMSSAEQAKLAKALGPKFAAAGLSAVKIIAYEHNWDVSSFPIEVLNDADAKSYLAGAAFHCYGGKPEDQNKLHDAHPDKEIWMQECNGPAEWNFGFEAAITDDMKWYIRVQKAWSRSVLMWNYALNTGGGPQNHGCNVCGGLLTVDENNLPRTWYSGFYYGMAMFSKFLTPGSYRASATLSDSSCMDALAFKNSDGTVHVTVVNSCQDTNLHVVWAGNSLTYNMPRGSVTMRWKLPIQA